MQIGPRISPLVPLSQTQPLTPLQPVNRPAQGPSNFGELLLDQLQEVNRTQQSADTAVHSMLTGESVNQAEMLTAIQKADLSFRLLLQVRNKLLDAYQQLSQMQI